MISVNAPPKKILNELRIKYRGRPEFEALPSVEQIQDRKRAKRKNDSGPIMVKTSADLKEYTQALELPSDPNELLEELGELDPKQLVILPGGVFEFGDGLGFVFSTPALLQNMQRALEEWEDDLPLETDGTYKVSYNGWPLLSLGSHTLHYNKNTHKIQQSYRPFSIMLTQTESKDAFVKLFDCTKNICDALYHRELTGRNANSDKADEIKNAYKESFPAASWTTCYPHIANKVQGPWKALLTKENKAYVAKVEEHINQLHLTRSQQQFDALADIVYNTWMEEGEEALASVVKKEYFDAPYNRWFITASGVAGVEPSSQPIEAWHKRLKYSTMGGTRVAMDTLLTTELPNTVYLESLDLVGPVRRKVEIEISECLEKAAEYDLKKDVLEQPTRTSEYFINTSEYVGMTVTATRVTKYKKSLEGTAGFGTSVEKFEEDYMSLHRVFYNKDLGNGKDATRGGWQCDCKGFWHSRQCAHIYVVQAVRKERNLVQETEDLLRRKKLGRKTKMKKALQMQPPSPVKEKRSVPCPKVAGNTKKKSRKASQPKKASTK